MPRNVRNFWLTARVDGQQTTVKAGPVRKDGGMDITLWIRDSGEVREALTILCRADATGKLVANVQPSGTRSQGSRGDISIYGKR